VVCPQGKLLIHCSPASADICQHRCFVFTVSEGIVGVAYSGSQAVLFFIVGGKNLHEVSHGIGSKVELLIGLPVQRDFFAEPVACVNAVFTGAGLAGILLAETEASLLLFEIEPAVKLLAAMGNFGQVGIAAGFYRRVVVCCSKFSPCLCPRCEDRRAGGR